MLYGVCVLNIYVFFGILHILGFKRTRSDESNEDYVNRTPQKNPFMKKSAGI